MSQRRWSRVVLLGTFLGFSGAAGAAICPPTMASNDCQQIHQHIIRNYKPAAHNHYGRYRSFLAVAAQQAGSPHRYIDFSAEAYGEGQLWLMLPPAQQQQALTVPPAQIRAWLFARAPAAKVAQLRAEVAAFNTLDGPGRVQWMTMRPARRLEAATLSPEQRPAFLRSHAWALTFDPYRVESSSALWNYWRLF